MSVWCAVQSSLNCSALEQGQCSAASPALGGSSRVNCRRSLVPTAQLLTLTCSPLVSPSKPYQLVKYRSWTVILHLLVLIMEIMQNPSVRNLSANVVTIFPPQTAQLCYMGLAWLPYRDYRFSHILQFSTPAPLNPKLNPAMLNPWIPSCSIAAQFSAAGPTLVFQRHLKNVLLLSKISRPCSVSGSGSKWKDFWWAKSHHQKSPSSAVHLDISLKILKKSTPLCFLMDPATNSLSNWIFMQSSDMI